MDQQKEQISNLDTSGLPRNGKAKAILLSSNATLFWRIFIPIFGTVFLAGFVVVLLAMPADELYLPFPLWGARAVVLLFFLGWLLLVRNTLWRLKRVEANDAYVFVTDYWNSARYPWTDVTGLKEVNRLGRKLIHLHLAGRGRFGQVISFLPGSRYLEWLKENGKDGFIQGNN